MNPFLEKVFSMITVGALIVGSVWFVGDLKYMPREEIATKYVQTELAEKTYVQQEALYGALKKLDDDRDARDLATAIDRLEAKQHLTPELFNEYDLWELEAAQRKLDNMQ